MFQYVAIIKYPSRCAPVSTRPRYRSHSFAGGRIWTIGYWSIQHSTRIEEKLPELRFGALQTTGESNLPQQCPRPTLKSSFTTNVFLYTFHPYLTLIPSQLPGPVTSRPVHSLSKWHRRLSTPFFYQTEHPTCKPSNTLSTFTDMYWFRIYSQTISSYCKNVILHPLYKLRQFVYNLMNYSV